MARPRLIRSTETIDQIVSDYTLRHVSTCDLARQWGTTPSTIRRYLLERGVVMRPRGRRPATPAPRPE